jgi:hypothetical protein
MYRFFSILILMELIGFSKKKKKFFNIEKKKVSKK